ncbi:hypothetical protein B7O87_09020 [Cylindrospermopsis raciborskii CENA303]|uniref:Uncharacterized protein n=1 Tax=Cylindrospermopsis raciborskii CENA303 TaxID=1170769 RepID=A0A1X4G7D2_9CYAN|nr:hypothetical protein CRD_02242 [Raphidiopsis brookii D9]OSO90932.1 hypothetical protein B7O87_09020 [Cylindrospermopsis raciborskii CENA303]
MLLVFGFKTVDIVLKLGSFCCKSIKNLVLPSIFPIMAELSNLILAEMGYYGANCLFIALGKTL